MKMTEEEYGQVFDTALAIYTLSKNGPEEPAAKLLVTAILMTISPENDLSSAAIGWWKQFSDTYRMMLKSQGFVIVNGRIVDDIPTSSTGPIGPSQGFL